MPKIFYVTDLHGSEICWKKFLNAGAFYKADVVILGGDVTGKAMVPIVQNANGAWDASLQDFRAGDGDRGRGRGVRGTRDEPRLLPDPRLRRGIPRHAGRRGHGRQALQGGHGGRHRALDRHGRGQAGAPRVSA